jgi:ADP-ribose pyrophosphatase YjhB (NUDIX family)
MAFPGGKSEENETDIETCKREVFEELGIDLNSNQFECIGRLSDREIKSPSGTQRLMVLCSFVFLQLSPSSPKLTLRASEVAAVYWIPIAYLVADDSEWTFINFDITNNVGSIKLPRIIKFFLSYIVGRFRFFGIRPLGSHCEIISKDGEEAENKGYPIWGLTLWMTSDLLVGFGLRNIANRGAVRYSARDLDLIMSVFPWKLTQMKFLDTANRLFGVNTIVAVRIAVVCAVIFRLSFLYFIAKKLINLAVKLI